MAEMKQYIAISGYDYQLPDERIAKYPHENRDLSKLLVYKNGNLEKDVFSNLAQYIPSGSLMVFNDTRVIQARLQFRKDTGAEIEIFCLEPFEPADYYQAFQRKENCKWKCLVGNLKKWKEGKVELVMNFEGTEIKLQATTEAEKGDWQLIRFTWQPENMSFVEILEIAGKTPIPPYLKRPSEEIDRSRYQTIYSMQNGSVAAPTAGLHFTPSVIEKLENDNIDYCNLTLHVGAGTFKPVKEDNVLLHSMHMEHFFIKKELIIKLLRHKRNITAVGTTSLRALESIFQIGCKLINNFENPFFVEQWEAYEKKNNFTVEQSMFALLKHFEKSGKSEIEAQTQIMIVPGYKFKIVQRLITNFHQPKSTLLLLVAAFVGEQNWKSIYEYALENDFRFLSYGDSSLLIP
jgi:S-adenosylmethionine:tRNA ribosyltransferase-isomerase